MAPDLTLPHGVRLTSQRRTLLRLVAEWHGSFTVADLHERGRGVEPGLGLATTYRTVELLRARSSPLIHRKISIKPCSNLKVQPMTRIEFGI